MNLGNYFWTSLYHTVCGCLKSEYLMKQSCTSLRHALDNRVYIMDMTYKFRCSASIFRCISEYILIHLSGALHHFMM